MNSQLQQQSLVALSFNSNLALSLLCVCHILSPTNGHFCGKTSLFGRWASFIENWASLEDATLFQLRLRDGCCAVWCKGERLEVAMLVLSAFSHLGT